MSEEKNKVLEFISTLHAFEKDNDLFSISDDKGLKYWDIVRAKIFYILHAQVFSAEPVSNIKTDKKETTPERFKQALNTIKEMPGFLRWWAVNEIIFYRKAKKKDWIVLKISRFINPGTQKPSDAVMDEIEKQLPSENVFTVESFNNRKFGRIRIKESPFFIYKLWYVKKLRKIIGFKKKRKYEISSLLKRNF